MRWLRPLELNSAHCLLEPSFLKSYETYHAFCHFLLPLVLLRG